MQCQICLSSSKPIESCSVSVSEFGRALQQEPTSSDDDAVMSSLHSSFPRFEVSDITIRHSRISISTHHKNFRRACYSTEKIRPASYFTRKTKCESVKYYLALPRHHSGIPIGIVPIGAENSRQYYPYSLIAIFGIHPGLPTLFLALILPRTSHATSLQSSSVVSFRNVLYLQSPPLLLAPNSYTYASRPKEVVLGRRSD